MPLCCTKIEKSKEHLKKYKNHHGFLMQTIYFPQPMLMSVHYVKQEFHSMTTQS